MLNIPIFLLDNPFLVNYPIIFFKYPHIFVWRPSTFVKYSPLTKKPLYINFNIVFWIQHFYH